eukprot:CAMPEP_0183717896 /NCGR_PEP_ID=MMETSP0737-20130205/11331_1 /TAXON_ID=385413 /ORGANISM="Thalassiosira miniscula, Strain CCMP1093" /LENGTH=511 /DNA_ID=CAMNT_0025947373 /DNA_START=161 /DNA_END=1692 /DNA_ORIENTATION=+
MADEDTNANADDDKVVDDFLSFHWDMHSDESSAECNYDNVHDGNPLDLLEELSRLATNEQVGYPCGSSDLASVIHRSIASPFPYEHRIHNDDKTTPNNDSDPNDKGDDGFSINGCIICNIIDLHRKNNAVKHYMGSMAQCRGAGGDALREAGAIDALLGILWRLMRSPLPVAMNGSEVDNYGCSSTVLLPAMALVRRNENNQPGLRFGLDHLCVNHQYLRNTNSKFNEIIINEVDMTAIDLATSCLGSLRDLSCGSALNRAAVLAWMPPSTTNQCDTSCLENGVHALSAYVKRYDQWKWEDILHLHGEKVCKNDSTMYTDLGKKELRLLTNALGAIRNTSHSTPDVCQEFFNHGLVDPLVWRLMPDHDPLERAEFMASASTSSLLPDASHPWREACFRAAGSLINLAEKCPDVAHRLASDRRLIYLLIEAWGGANALTPVVPNNKYNGASSSKLGSSSSLPLLHLGLAAILHAAGDGGALEGGLDDVMIQVLEKEKIRKRVAQRKEEERKR